MSTPAKLDTKGQASSGTTEIGWSVSVGVHNLDMTDFLASVPKPDFISTIKVTANYKKAKTNASLVMIQRLPDKVVFPSGQRNRIWQIDPRRRVCFVAMGGLNGPNPNKKSKNKTFHSVNFTLTAGGTVTKVKGQPLAADPSAKNAVGLGIDVQLEVAKSWSAMVLMDDEPGYYVSGEADDLMTDFSELVANAEGNRLIGEIFGWLSHAASYKSKLRQGDRDGANKERLKLLAGGRAGLVASGVLQALGEATTILGIQPITNASRLLILKITTADVDEVQKALTSVSQRFHGRGDDVIRGNFRHDLTLKLDENLVGMLDYELKGVKRSQAPLRAETLDLQTQSKLARSGSALRRHSTHLP